MGAEATGNNLKYDQYLEFRSQVFRYLGGELIVTFSTAALRQISSIYKGIDSVFNCRSMRQRSEEHPHSVPRGINVQWNLKSTRWWMAAAFPINVIHCCKGFNFALFINRWMLIVGWKLSQQFRNQTPFFTLFYRCREKVAISELISRFFLVRILHSSKKFPLLSALLDFEPEWNVSP